MPWYAGRTRSGEELECRENLIARGIEAFVLTGLRARCPRKNWQEPAIVELFPVFPTYVFLNIGREVNTEAFSAQVRLRGFVRDEHSNRIEISTAVMVDLFKRQANREFDNWLQKAITFFRPLTGMEFVMPAGPLAGAKVTIVSIVGAGVVYQTTMLGQVIRRRIELRKIWPMEAEARPHILTLELGEALTLRAADPDAETVASAPAFPEFEASFFPACGITYASRAPENAAVQPEKRGGWTG
jgi:hypothetical protein